MFGHRQSQAAAAVDVCSLLAGSNPYRLVVRASRCGRQQKSPPKGFGGAQKAFNLAAFLGATVLRCELVFCNFGDWWRSVLHLGMCLAARGNLTMGRCDGFQFGGLQGLCMGRCDGWADNDLGTGSSWRQSRHNQTPLAAMRS